MHHDATSTKTIQLFILPAPPKQQLLDASASKNRRVPRRASSVPRTTTTMCVSRVYHTNLLCISTSPSLATEQSDRVAVPWSPIFSTSRVRKLIIKSPFVCCSVSVVNKRDKECSKLYVATIVSIIVDTLLEPFGFWAFACLGWEAQDEVSFSGLDLSSTIGSALKCSWSFSFSLNRSIVVVSSGTVRIPKSGKVSQCKVCWYWYFTIVRWI